MDQMLGINGPEMTLKKILVNPNDDAKGDDDRATNYIVIQVLLPISLTFQENWNASFHQKVNRLRQPDSMQLIPSTFIIAQSALEMKKVFIKQLLIVGSLCLAKKKKFKTIIFTSLYLYIGNIQVIALFFGFYSNVFCVITSRWFFCSLAAQLYNLNWMVGHVSTQSELKFNHIRVFNRFFPPQFSSMNSNPIYIQIHITQLRLAVILQ